MNLVHAVSLGLLIVVVGCTAVSGMSLIESVYAGRAGSAWWWPAMFMGLSFFVAWWFWRLV
jgi:hypothetical protein